MAARPVVVPFFSFRAVPSTLRQEWQDAMAEVISEGVMIGGRFVSHFEDAWAERVNVKGCVGVANGLDALVLALRGSGIGPGNRVAVPAHTFIATWLSVRAVGAEPVAIDVCDDGQINLDELEQLPFLVDAVIPVHMHGISVDMPRLMSWANGHDITVIEDCAQAHGATVGGRPVGSWGHAAAFSFYPTKNLGALGDAGAVVSNDLALLNRVRTIANYGASRENKYVHVSDGVNSRLDPMQASVLSVNLRHLDRWNMRRQVIAAELLATVTATPGLSALPVSPEGSVWHHFVVFSERREELQTRLGEKGIGTDIHYPVLAADEIASISGLAVDQQAYPNARRFSEHGLSLPIHPWMTDEEVEAVSSALRICA